MDLAAGLGAMALISVLIKDEFRGKMTVVNAVDPAAIQTDIFEQCSREHVYYMVFGIPMNLRGNVLIMVSAR